MFTECANCGYQYSHPWSQDHCGSAKACNGRKAINDAERAAGLTLTVWNMHGHELARAAKAARERLARHAARQQGAAG